MKPSRVRSPRIVLFAVMLIAACVSLADRGWAMRLKMEGYYADLAATLDVPATLVAGTAARILLHIENRGPTAVENHVVVLRTDAGLGVNAQQCLPFDTATTFCLFDEVLPVGGQLIHPLQLLSVPEAEGAVALGAAVESNHFDPEPGNDFDVAALWLERRYDLVVQPDPSGMASGPQGSWISFLVHNPGPSAALGVRLVARRDGDAELPSLCTGFDGALCRIGPEVDLPPGSSAQLRVMLLPLLAGQADYVVSVEAIEGADGEIHPADNAATWLHVGRIFDSGFE